jgi:hypothetical protein
LKDESMTDRRRVTGADGAGCYGSVLLDEHLRSSLAEMNGAPVPWVHGCVLDHGHHGDHGEPVYQRDGEPPQWIRWPEHGPARMEKIQPGAPGRHAQQQPSSASHPQPPPPRPANAPPHHDAEPALPAAGSQSEALWAIAAALERLADVVAQASNLHR